MTACRTEEIHDHDDAELSQAIGNAAKEQGTTPETLAAEALRERFGRVESGAATPGARSLADRLAPHVAALENSCVHRAV